MIWPCPVPAATVIATGDAHTCAVLSDGSVACWGATGDGQAGLWNGTYASAPVTVDLGAGMRLSIVVDILDIVGPEYGSGSRFLIWI
jgi:alpha-tubulin suppressor-like RCC1 family protein